VLVVRPESIPATSAIHAGVDLAVPDQLRRLVSGIPVSLLARTVLRTLKTGGVIVAGSTVRFESRITIQRPVDAVFERLADLSGYGRWMHRRGLFRRCAQISEGPVRQGTTYFDATRMGTFVGEVTEFTSPSRLAFSETLRWFGSPVSRARPEYTLVADGERTVVHHIAVGELFGAFRLMKPAAALMAKVERRATLKSLKRSLESEEAGTWQPE
jgi:uncharacterized protein YndB with AHSA1/START domain